MVFFVKRLQVTIPTVKAWLHHLEASYVVFTVGPYYENFGKRLVKSPKLYFTDTGLALLPAATNQCGRGAGL